MLRKYLDKPIVAVGAIVLHEGKVLLIRRAKEPNAGKWSLPGGAQELGETVNEAAIREVYEETGVAISVIELVEVIDSITKDDQGKIAYHYTLVDLLCSWKSGTPKASDDALEAKWFSVNEINELGMWSETTRIIKKAVGMSLDHTNQQDIP